VVGERRACDAHRSGQVPLGAMLPALQRHQDQHSGSVPPDAPSASSKARLTIFAVRVSWTPIDSIAGARPWADDRYRSV
jgi:hypothetical protein